jgi:hypothetical protein
MNSKYRLVWSLSIVALLGLAVAGEETGNAQDSSHYFPETGHKVSGVFWTYWQGHGGLGQQGYPISDELQELSHVDGKTYSVQYFERAVFELHPENQPPYDVLLSLLGQDQYTQDSAEIDNDVQVPDHADGIYFPETRHWIGGIFRAYWEGHGGLAQQGYPLTDEFMGTGGDGKQYVMQYFERAVFEYHPENQPPYDVLLARLGAQAFHSSYEAFCTGCGAGGRNPPEPQPEPGLTCDVSSNIKGSAEDTWYWAAKGGAGAHVHAYGFQANEAVILSLIAPNGAVVARLDSRNYGDAGGDPTANLMGSVSQDGTFDTQVPVTPTWVGGRWSVEIVGTQSQNRSLIYFCVYHRGKTRVWPVVQPGESSGRVKMVQYLLLARGYTGFVAGGHFGNLTEGAVTQFQASKGLSVTGTVDANTWEALIVTVGLGDTGDAVRAVQSRLLEMNFYDTDNNGNPKLDADGVFGSLTAEAIKTLQGFEELPQSGIVGPDTWYDLARFEPQ